MIKKVTVLLLIYFLSAPFVYAVKRAPFGNGANLQPIPVIAHPDVSGNVNKVNNIDPDQLTYDQSSDVNEEVTPVKPTAPAPTTAHRFAFFAISILLLIFLVAAITAGIFFFRGGVGESERS